MCQIRAGIKTSKTNNGYLRELPSHEGKTWRLLARYILFVRDVSRHWNAVITLHWKRSNTMPKVHTKIEQSKNCRTYAKELLHSFSSVLRGYGELDLSHDSAYSLRGGISQESDSGNPVEGIWSDTEPNQFCFFPTSQGPLVKNSNLCIFTCSTCVQHIEHI